MKVCWRLLGSIFSVKQIFENKYSFFYSFCITKIVLIFIETTINFCNIFTWKSRAKTWLNFVLTIRYWQILHHTLILASVLVRNFKSKIFYVFLLYDHLHQLPRPKYFLKITQTYCFFLIIINMVLKFIYIRKKHCSVCVKLKQEHAL